MRLEVLAMSDPGSTLRDVGRVIDFEVWRRRLRPGSEPSSPSEQPSLAPEGRSPTDRLDAVLGRLDPLVRSGSGHVATRVETELLAIIGAVNSGLLDEALARAERLTSRLEHPSARAAR
jgi:hypothetical protein